MNSALQANGERLNASNDSNWSRIRRVFVERDVRPVTGNNTAQNGQSDVDSAIKTINKQHEDEQRELQELNTKLSSYLEHVHDLETFNGQLLAELDEIRAKWGDNTEQFNRTYGPQLKTLRNGIDTSLRDRILHELQLQQSEYDIGQTQQRISAFDDDTASRLNTAQQELTESINDLASLKNQFDRRSTELIQHRTYLKNLGNEFDGLEAELLNHRFERILMENELQTIREEGAFENANYQVQRQEILSLNVPNIDLSKFYRTELARAISDIREDFETLSQSQLHELEEYYRIKTEEIQEEAAQEKQRRRLLNEENEENTMSSILSSWTELNEEYKQLKMDNTQLEIDFNDSLEDLTRIREEQTRENDKLDLQLNQLQEELQNKRDIVNGVLENNVSLQFELLTYRNLLKSEEKRLHRKEQEQQEQQQQLQTSTISPSSTANTKDYSVQKLAVKKASKGAIVFDPIDFINDCVIITYDASTGNNQSLDKWTIHRRNDEQKELIYQFPSSFILKPKQTIRILSKRSPQSARSENDVLIAEQIETWGHGQSMITRLIDNRNDEKASITETRLPT